MNISLNSYLSSNSAQLREEKLLIERILLEKNNISFDIVLDIGCGTGEIQCFLASKLNAGHIYGVDIDEAMIAFAKQNNTKDNISYIVQDFRVEFDRFAPELKALEGKVSLVMANYSLDWMLDKQLVSQNLNRLLKKGGKVYATVYYIENPFNKMSVERKVIYEKMFTRIPEPHERHMEWLTAFKSQGLNVSSNDFIIREKVQQLTTVSKENQILVNKLFVYFMGTDVERQRLSGELPAIILSNNHVFTDENTGEEMMKIVFHLSLFIMNK